MVIYINIIYTFIYIHIEMHVYIIFPYHKQGFYTSKCMMTRYTI